MSEPASEPVGLSIEGYARHRGVARSAVDQRIKAGSLPTGARRVGKRWVIDPVIADAEWAAHTQPRVTEPKAAGAPSGLAAATQREREARADAIELENARKKKLVVPAAGVEQLVTGMVVLVRTALGGVPTRYRQRCPHLTPADLTVLDLLLREVCEEMADAASRIP